MAVLLAVTRLWSRAGVCRSGSASDGPNAGGFHFWPVWVSQQGFGFWNWSSVGWCVCVCVCVCFSPLAVIFRWTGIVSSVCEVCVFHGERTTKRAADRWLCFIYTAQFTNTDAPQQLYSDNNRRLQSQRVFRLYSRSRIKLFLINSLPSQRSLVINLMCWSLGLTGKCRLVVFTESQCV